MNAYTPFPAMTVPVVREIDASTKRTFRVVAEGDLSRLELWTLLGGWFTRGCFSTIAAAEQAGREFVRTGRWPALEPVNLPARLDAIAEKRRTL